MKSYNNLFEKFISDENIDLAIANSFRGKKKKRRDVSRALKDIEKLKKEVRAYAIDFHNATHTPKLIYDGISHKQRLIIVPTMMEQIIHHMVCNILIPIIQPSIYEHSYASLPDRGAVRGKFFIEKYIRKHPKGCKYYFKADIRKYFETIPHDRLKAKFEKIIRDKRFLSVIFEIIDVVDDGIPIGFYTSQWFANFYLTDFDHWLKEEMEVSGYWRYMDDIVIFHSNKKELHQLRKIIEYRLKSVEGLAMKDNWQVVRFHYVKKDGSKVGHDLDFMGYRFFRGYTTMRKSILRKARRKADKIAKKAMFTIYDCRQMLSYSGYFKRTATHDYYEKWIRPKVDIASMRTYVGIYDRRHNNDKVA